MNRTSRPLSRCTSLALLSIVLLLAACTARSATKGKITGADAQPGAVPNIVGSYSVNGLDPLGTEYGGNLTIKPGASPTEYLLQWIVTGSIQEGQRQARRQHAARRVAHCRGDQAIQRGDNLHRHDETGALRRSCGERLAQGRDGESISESGGKEPSRFGRPRLCC